ncbi:MAG: electron transporter RnfC, partial [Lachnospiraceae bacterium]|nr:electron transporter RnfC [Lachnospiraceae bacterium]
MAKDTFRGGVHPEEHKELSRDQALRVYDAKGEMVFLLSQHIGKPAKPLVKKNDEVLVGQVIA